MVTLVKHEWHQVDSQFAYELTEETLAEIYPDLDDAELADMLQRIESGEVDLEVLLQDAYDNGVEIEWDRQYDDWWTDRKGGYEVTFEVGDESSWHTPDPEPEDTHKCTKCKWSGQAYEAEWQWEDKDGNAYDEAKNVCPYCESDLALTEHGVTEENARRQRMAEIEAMFTDDE